MRYREKIGGNMGPSTESGSLELDNTVVNDLKCETNSLISGGGNTAKKKLDQCSSF